MALTSHIYILSQKRQLAIDACSLNRKFSVDNPTVADRRCSAAGDEKKGRFCCLDHTAYKLECIKYLLLVIIVIQRRRIVWKIAFQK